MKIGRSVLPVSVLPFMFIASVVLLLFAFSSSSPRALDQHQHQKLVGSTFDLIVKAKSSPVFVFFLCNVIIVAILLGGSSTPASELDWWATASPMNVVQEVVVEEEVLEQVEVIEEEVQVEEEEVLEQVEVIEEEVQVEEEDGDQEGYDSDDEEDDGDDDDDCSWDDNDDDDEDDEGDEDLNRRIEEFIEKINGIWREEFLRDKLLGIKAVFE